MGAGLIVYDTPLVSAIFLGRRKRFFADVRLNDGTEAVAHCANTGSMAGLLAPGAPCRIAPARGKGRKLAWSLEQLQVDGAWVMVHTARPNRVVEAAIRAGQVDELGGYDEVLRERPYGTRSRIDLLLRGAGRPDAYVEVKNVTWVRDRVALFPDAVSARGTKHLHELVRVRRDGARAVLVLHIARGDCDVFAPADERDPVWAEAFGEALDAGVEVLPLVCEVGESALGLGRRLPVRRVQPSVDAGEGARG